MLLPTTNFRTYLIRWTVIDCETSEFATRCLDNEEWEGDCPCSLLAVIHDGISVGDKSTDTATLLHLMYSFANQHNSTRL
jgi:hypothetical protein